MPDVVPLLRPDALANELADRPGLIPVSLDARQQRILWMDLEGYHCYDGFFHQSLAMFEALRRSPETFASGLDALDEAPVGGMAPAGFIFHTGRCGSTLLARVLARVRSHLVLSEAPPHNQFWDTLPWPAAPTPDATRRYRNLVLALGRRRLPAYNAHLIKFTSWNLLALPFIRATFPDVPALFIHREPVEVLVSMLANPPGWLAEPAARARVTGWDDATVKAADDLSSARQGLCNLFRAATEASAHGLRCLAHPQLTAPNLPAILDYFDLRPSDEALAQMQAQFTLDAKQSRGGRPYQPDSTAKQQAAPASVLAATAGELQSLHLDLLRGPANLLTGNRESTAA